MEGDGERAAAGAEAAMTAEEAGQKAEATTSMPTTTTPSENAAAAPAAAVPSQAPPEGEKRGANGPDAPPAEQDGKRPASEKGEEKNDADDAGDAPPDDDALLAAFFSEVKSADRDSEVNRILGAFKLNPYEQLGCRLDATDAEVSRAYRKASLLVHPDKCSHPRASDAFDLLGAASAALREGAEGLDELRYFLNAAREQVRAERKKEIKKEGHGAARLAALVVDGGEEGVRAAFEASEQFHERWKLAARELLARNEFKRRKLTLRLKETEERLAEEAKQEKKKAKQEKKAEKAWEKSREGRVGAWRDFAKGGGGGGGAAKKKKSGGGGGGVKGLPSSWGAGASTTNNGSGAAAASVRDPERPYVRRPAGGGGEGL